MMIWLGKPDVASINVTRLDIARLDVARINITAFRVKCIAGNLKARAHSLFHDRGRCEESCHMLMSIGQILFELGRRVGLGDFGDLGLISKHSSFGNHGNVLTSNETLLTIEYYLYTPILWIGVVAPFELSCLIDARKMRIGRGLRSE